MIKIKNLVKKFGNIIAVNNLNLEIKNNEIFALLGLNGAGKSTTIKILCLLLKKDSGHIEINNFDLDKDDVKIKKIISVSPQETAIANNLTVQENLEFIAGMYDINDENEISNLIKTFGLTDKSKIKAKNLSGGQKRRLSIAMALITKPEILILDEPTLGLDIKARKTLWKIIESYKKKITIILTTHYLEEAENLADRIAIMNKGKLAVVGTKDEIIKKANTQNFEDAFLKLAGDDE